MAFNYTCHVVGDFWRPAHWVVGTVPVVVDQEGMQNKWHILWKDACKKGVLASVSKEGSYLQWYTYFCSDEVNNSDESILGDLWATITECYQKSVPKVQVAGCSWTRIHPIYVVLHEVVWHAAWYTERAKMAAISSGTSHVTTKQHCKYTTLVDIQTCYKKLVTHLESHATWVQWTYLRAGNSAKLKKKSTTVMQPWLLCYTQMITPWVSVS